MRTFDKGPLVKKSLVLLALALGASAPAFAEGAEHGSGHEAAGGDSKLDQLLPVCQSCHGEHGAKPILASYPVLAGQHTNYIDHALKDYRSGARNNAVMKAQVANLSDADIKALAHYFSQQESPLYTFTLPKSGAPASAPSPEQASGQAPEKAK